MTKYKINQQLYLDSHYWRVTMLTSTYATIEREDRPSISRMVKL